MFFVFNWRRCCIRHHRLTTVQRTSIVKLNLHPNSPKTQLGVKRLLLKKIIPTRRNCNASSPVDESRLHRTYSHEWYQRWLDWPREWQWMFYLVSSWCKQWPEDWVSTFRERLRHLSERRNFVRSYFPSLKIREFQEQSEHSLRSPVRIHGSD